MAILIKFCAGYDAEGGGKVLLNKNDVETIALIERIKNAKDFVQIGIDAEEYYKIKDEDN